MRKMIKLLKASIVMILALSMILVNYIGVFASPPPPPNPSILENSLVLLVGDDQTLTKQNSSGWTVNFSADTAAVTVDPTTGKITAASEGTAVVTATFKKAGRSDVTDTCTVTVYKKPVITDNITLFLNESGQVQVTDGEGWNVVWSSQSSDKVSVTQSGLVTGLKATNYINIKATFTRNGKTIERICKVNVLELKINKSSLSMYVGDDEQLDIYNDSTWTTVWSSANPAIATVDGNGMVEGLYPGEVIVTATSTKEGCSTVTNICTVTVKERSYYEHIDADQEGFVNYVIQKNYINQSTTLLDAVVSNFKATVNGEEFDSHTFGGEYRIDGKWSLGRWGIYWDDLEVHFSDEIILEADLTFTIDDVDITVHYIKTCTRDELIAAALLCPQHTGFDFILIGEYAVNTNYYSVDFNDYDGEDIDLVTDILEGTSILETSVPMEPTRDNDTSVPGIETTFLFAGWDDYDTETVENYTAAEIAEMLVFENRIFQAVYIPTNYYTISFFEEDGTTLIDTRVVLEYDNLTDFPIAPDKDDSLDGLNYYTFDQWVDMEGNPVSFSEISEPMSVKALYTENNYIVVNFYVQQIDGTIVLEGTQYLKPGEDAIDPAADLMRENSYILGQWDGILTGIEEDTDFTARVASVAGVVEKGTVTRQPVVAGATEVATGDNAPIVSMSILLLVSAISIVSIYNKRRKNI